MGNITASGIWTPDEGDNLDPEVWSAAMSASIENGIGVRLTRQEQAIGLKASIASGTRVKYSTGVIAPYAILGDGTSNFIQGLTIAGGVVPITIPGMYLITASAALAPYGSTATDSAPENVDRSIAIQLIHNGTELNGCEVAVAPLQWQTAQASGVVLCAAGDTLSVNWYSSGPAGTPDPTIGARTASNTALQSLSIVLITPVAI